MKRLLQRDTIVSLFLVACFWLLVSQNAPAIIDINDNTMSDPWEKNYHNQTLFPDTGDYLPAADPDGDAWTNAQEAAAGTNPFEANPPDGIVRPELAPETAAGAYTLIWPSLHGKAYQLQCSETLASGTWIDIGAPLLGDGDPIIKILNSQPTNGALPPKLFWRVAITDTDTDGDGVTDAEEYQIGTDPAFADTDGDGLTDMEEIHIDTDPKDPDTDDDDLNDYDDADPLDSVINWRKTVSPRFAVTTLKEETDGLKLNFMDVSHDGIVLMHDFTNLTDGSGMFSAFDANGAEHLIPNNRPGLGSPEGYFASMAISLIGNTVLGERLVNSANQECTWDLGSVYQPYAIEGYHDDFFDAHHGYFVRGKPSEDLTQMFTHAGILNGSEWGLARIETHGNICTQKGYWRYDSTNQTYGAKNALPEDAAGVTAHSAASATLKQIWPPTPPATEPQTHEWNLIMGTTCLMNSKDEAAFVKSSLTWTEAQGSPVSVTNQGWVACGKQIWANGKWRPVKELLGITTPGNATLLGMIDNGIGVARIETTGAPSKIVLLLPIWVTGVDSSATPANPDAQDRGVDRISIFADDSPDNGHQSDSWIMAPISRTNTVRFLTSASQTQPLRLSAENATFAPAELTSPDQQVTVTGTGTATSESGLVLKTGTRSIPSPVRVKAMKSRNVKVTIHAVGLNAVPPEIPVVPDLGEIQSYLNSVFLPQINAEITVTPGPTEVPLSWDIGEASIFELSGAGSEGLHENNGTFDFTESDKLEQEDKYINLTLHDANADINVYVLTRHLRGWIDKKPGAMSVSGGAGMTRRGPNVILIDGKQNEIITTIAHEIGHCMIDYGHPNLSTDPLTVALAKLPGMPPQKRGPAPHDGVGMAEWKKRLMYSDTLPVAGKTMVKSEWDAAEIWLLNTIDKKNQQ